MTATSRSTQREGESLPSTAIRIPVDLIRDAVLNAFRSLLGVFHEHGVWPEGEV
jgi:hypothetical protein